MKSIFIVLPPPGKQRNRQRRTCVPLSRHLSSLGGRFTLLLGCLALLVTSGFGTTPQVANLGPEDQSRQISVTVWLNLHNKATLDAMVQDMYDNSSPNYHHFLTLSEFKKQFAPTAKESATVRDFLTSHNLKVTAIDKNNHFVVARGSVADVQTAFHTKINRTTVNGVAHHVNATPPSIAGPAAALVSSVQGLSDLIYTANVKPSTNPETGTPYAGVRPSDVGANGLFFSAQCLRPPETVTFTTDGSTPKAIYAGNRYGADITNTNPPNLPSCGYDPAEMQTAYGLNELYKSGLDGTGQTIVIVDAFGSNTILADANLFAQLYGLPPLTDSNFSIYTPNGSATCTATNGCISGNWQYETTLDVEWAHAIAPGANIVLVLGVDNSFTNLDIANLFAIENGFGTVISNSFGIPEVVLQFYDPSELTVQNGISEIAAALGISHDISSGDSGDFLAEDTADGIPAVSVTANCASPYATGVGGTSTFLDSKQNIELQTGWGLNFTRIAEPTPNPPTVPPLLFGFQEGSGGGASVVFARPKYQKGPGISGKFRLVPDISMNADPQTGNEIIVTPTSVPGDDQYVAVFGGTSLSTPMFSAFWSIANQAAAAQGLGPLGNAAPILYELPGDAIIDVNVTQADTLLNVTGTIFNPPNPPLFESAAALAAPQPPTKRFVSALFQSQESTRWDVFTFGTDSSLATGPGWDNVTGLGTPNGEDFIKKVVKAVK
jgi:subtilase family serine protease